MCIICVKPANVPMPDNRTINTMWQANADGAGFAYWRPGMLDIAIEKGFMKLKKLREALTAFNFTDVDLVVLHFRWATHGLTDGGNCHPFPLSNKTSELRAISGQFPTAIAHNGVFGNMACHETLSDTQKFIAKILANEAVIANLDNPAIRELISGYCGTSSKLAVMRPARLTLIGEFVKDDATGLMYSNHGYKTHTYYSQKVAKDFADDGMDDDYVPSTHLRTIKKKCELCSVEDEIFYVDDYQLFLCSKCLQYNLAIDNAEGKIKDWEGHLN